MLRVFGGSTAFLRMLMRFLLLELRRLLLSGSETLRETSLTPSIIQTVEEKQERRNHRLRRIN